MPTSEIEQYEIHVQSFEVEANSEAEAIAKLFDGAAQAMDNSLAFVEVCEDRGLPAAEYRELADQLRSLDVLVNDDVIPSIRSIERAS